MEPVAFNLRGTNGSGKTWVARKILEASRAEPDMVDSNGKIRTYRGELYDVPITILGSYKNQNGGCDTIQPYYRIPELIKLTMMEEMKPGILFFEGLLISHSFGSVGKTMEQYGSRAMTGFLDTPLSVCIHRIEARRKERGVTKEFNARNVIKDHDRVAKCRLRQYLGKHPMVDIPHDDPYEATMYHIRSLVNEYLTTDAS
jgi:hypothetical protein